MEIKRGRPGEFKLSEEGTVTVAFSQLNVVDKDADVTVPGAIPTKDVPMSAYGHTSWDGELPIGRGTITEADGWGVLNGRFLMETDQGRNGYHTVKAMADLQEWSYGYKATDFSFGQQDGKNVRFLKRLDIFEVSPVLIGAGVGTRTLSIKAAKAAIAAHSTAIDDGAWDAGANETNCPAERGALRASHAWVEDGADPDLKGSFKFLHHLVSADGNVGAANMTACSTGIGYLNRAPGAAGRPDIPSADREGVWAHLAEHLRDGKRTPPELRASLPDGLTFADHSDRMLADVTDWMDRTKGLVDLRTKEGRVLSGINRDRLAALADALGVAHADLVDLIASAEPPKAADRLRIEIEVLTAMARANGVPI